MTAVPAAPSFELVAGEPGRPMRLTGAANLATARALLERGSELIGTGPDVEVDLSAVTHVDSAGLAVLLAWLERARHGGQRLRYSSIPAQLRGLAHLSGVGEMLKAAEVQR